MYQAEKDFDSQQNNPYIDWADEVIVFVFFFVFHICLCPFFWHHHLNRAESSPPSAIHPEMIISLHSGHHHLSLSLSFPNPYFQIQITEKYSMTRNQINGTFLFQNRVKVKVVGEVSEK